MARSAELKSPTYDEPVHLAAGILYWRTGDFRYNREHPPLMKLLAGLPLVLTGAQARFTAADGTVVDREYALAHKWEYADRVLYENRVSHEVLTRRARLMMILATLAFGAVVFCWAASLFGPWAGLAAAAVFLLDPNVLAHGRIVKNDMGLAGLILATFFLVHRYHRGGKPASIALAAVCLALALGAKLSALIVVPLFVACAGVAMFEQVRGSRGRRLLICAGALALLFLLADLTLNAVYGFHSLHEFERGIAMLAEHRDAGHRAFLLEKVSESGWWHYYPVALAVKTPLPVLLLWAAALLSLRRILRHVGWFDLVMLLAPPLVLFLLAANSRVNIGLRHVLVLYPFLAVLASGCVARAVQKGWRRPAAIALVVLLAPVSITAHPDYLSYFNALARGPEQKARLLSDSNLDWGQDLPRLAGWMRENGAGSVYLDYFGTARPEAHGVAGVPLSAAIRNGRFRPEPGGPQWAAVSTTAWQGTYGGANAPALLLFRRRRPDVYLGDTFRLYRVSRPTDAGSRRSP